MLKIITIKDGADINKVAADIQTKGFQIKTILEHVGSIHVECDDPTGLDSVDGVAAVEDDIPMQTQ